MSKMLLQRNTSPLLNSLLMILICLAGALLNVFFHYVIARTIRMPLFIDTIFTITVTLLAGPFWGALTGAITNLIANAIWFWGWEGHLFTICSIATAIVTYLFMRLFPRELDLRQGNKNHGNVMFRSTRLGTIMERVVILFLLSFALCIAMSILGGLIASFIQSLNPSHAGEPNLSPDFVSTMFPQGFSIILKEILSRIPINIVDRPVSAFLGYGAAFLVTGWMRFTRQGAH